MQSDDQTSTGELSVLLRLRKEGSLSDNEFELLRKKVTSSANDQPRDSKDDTEKTGSSNTTFGLLVAAAIGLIVVDHVKGPIFPDEAYCVVGAGKSVVVAGRTEANSWSANNGCGAYKPECANGWVHHPAAEVCIHGSLWDSIRSKLKGFSAAPFSVNRT
jgi:hypothetical protein